MCLDPILFTLDFDCLQCTATVKNVNFIFIQAVFNFLPIKQHLSVALFFWTYVSIKTFFLTFETFNCGKGMVGFLLFFFLVIINLVKCNPIALMFDDLCNEFWVIFPFVYESKCGG